MSKVPSSKFQSKTSGAELLRQFSHLAQQCLDRGWGHRPCDYALTLKSTLARPFRLLIFGSIHGDEIGGLLAINDLLLRILNGENLLRECELTLAVGNPRAVEAERRFTSRDLNRSFGRGKAGGPDAVYEDERAHELEPLILKCDFAFDLHQTIQPTPTGFFVARAQAKSLALLADWKLGLPIVCHPHSFSHDGDTSGVFATNHRIGSLTLETGQLGDFVDQRERARELIERLLNLTPSFLTEPPPNAGILAQSLASEPKRTPLFTWGQTVVREPELALVPGLANFSPIKKGQVLAVKPGGAGEIRAESDGSVLFPKYGEVAMRSAELLRCLRPLEADELADWLTPTERAPASAPN